MEDIFGYEEDFTPEADDLPPPAYQPTPEQVAPMASAEEDERETFVAPRARALGEPSPDAMARLQAAVNRNPREAQPMAERPAAAPAPAAEKPRFGINSLINRMTGNSAEGGQQTARSVRQQPPVQAQQSPQEMRDEEQDQIEIPAFLRRQAN